MAWDTAASMVHRVFPDLELAEISTTLLNYVFRVFFCVFEFLMAPLRWYQNLESRPPCPPVTNQLLLLSATELARKIRDREIKSEEVVSAYIARCREVNPILNAIVEDRFESALEESREVDRAISSRNQSRERLTEEKPLLGVPFTVKESIAVKGLSYNSGVKRRKEQWIASNDAPVVAQVRSAGGIPLLVSNTPEYCMNWETVNNVTGFTRNPYDTRKTSGGSSGGEAALLGSGSSVLGLCTDVGGSARLPALFCGVFGHKPSAETMDPDGTIPTCDDEVWSKYFTVGLMTRYAEDLPLLWQVARKRDSTRKIPEVKRISLQDIKFFYMEDARSIAMRPAEPEMTTAIHRMINHLDSEHGIQAQKVSLKEMRYMFEVPTTVFLTEINNVDTVFTKGTNRGEWNNVYLEFLKWLCGATPYCFYHFIYVLLKGIVYPVPLSYRKKMLDRNTAMRKRFEELLGDSGVLIYPTFSSTALFRWNILSRILDTSYMTLFTGLGLPVTQCPAGFNTEGIPIGFQIIGNRGCDHVTMAAALEVERAFGGWQQSSKKKTV